MFEIYAIQNKTPKFMSNELWPIITLVTHTSLGSHKHSHNTIPSQATSSDSGSEPLPQSCLSERHLYLQKTLIG